MTGCFLGSAKQDRLEGYIQDIPSEELGRQAPPRPGTRGDPRVGRTNDRAYQENSGAAGPVQSMKA